MDKGRLPIPNAWAAQELANIPVSEFPVIGPDGKVNFEPFYVVMGFAGTKYGLAILDGLRRSRW